MSKPYRYTGEAPPPEVLLKFPNWVQALDEEGEPDQDETTIRPDDRQDVIADSTQHTTCDAILPNGNKCPALIFAWEKLNQGNLDQVVVYEGDWSVENEWVVVIDGNQWRPDFWANETRNPGDANSFPLRLVSRLPCSLQGEKIEITLLPDGRVQKHIS